MFFNAAESFPMYERYFPDLLIIILFNEPNSSVKNLFFFLPKYLVKIKYVF